MKLRTLEERMRHGAKAYRLVGFTGVTTLVIGLGTLIGFIEKGAPVWQVAVGAVSVLGLVLYAWDRWSESKESGGAYSARLNELAEATYFSVPFATNAEAVAFVAELSGRIPRPEHELASWEEDVEVSVRVRMDGATVYLSDGAARAFTPDFPAPATMQTIPAKSLTTLRVPLLIGAPERPMSPNDVFRRLEGKPLSGRNISFRLTK